MVAGPGRPPQRSAGLLESEPWRSPFTTPDFPTGLVLEAKARVGRTVSVCIPARDEGSTVGSVVRAVVQPFLAAHGGNGLVDEVIVLDDGSRDDTAEQARDAGARVVAGPGGAGGKGQAMAAALAASTGDIVAFLDADVANTTPAFVTGLLGPLLTTDARRPREGLLHPPAAR